MVHEAPKGPGRLFQGMSVSSDRPSNEARLKSECPSHLGLCQGWSAGWFVAKCPFITQLPGWKGFSAAEPCFPDTVPADGGYTKSVSPSNSQPNCHLGPLPSLQFTVWNKKGKRLILLPSLLKALACCIYWAWIEVQSGCGLN
jgi:hypothetical protein